MPLPTAGGDASTSRRRPAGGGRAQERQGCGEGGSRDRDRLRQRGGRCPCRRRLERRCGRGDPKLLNDLQLLAIDQTERPYWFESRPSMSRLAAQRAKSRSSESASATRLSTKRKPTRCSFASVTRQGSSATCRDVADVLDQVGAHLHFQVSRGTSLGRAAGAHEAVERPSLSPPSLSEPRALPSRCARRRGWREGPHPQQPETGPHGPRGGGPQRRLRY